MTEVQRILDQIKRAWEGEAWHGPSLQELLANVDAATANARPILGVHSIREIVYHLAFWKNNSRERLAGARVFPSDAESWPTTDESPAAWQDTTKLLETHHRALAEAVAQITDARLNEPVPGKQQDFAAYILLHGVIQHDLYHAGQIALLKKAATGR
jgi:uncharacterized damage-inducible protein DinB